MTPTPDTLADPAQIIADLQRANTELQRRLDESNAERDEALEQQTATAEVLGVINASPGDLAPVFDAILEKATRLCEAAFGILLSFDGKHFRHVALRSVPAAYADFMRQNPPDYGPETGPGRIMAGDLYRRADPNRRALVDLAGARTVVLVPLLKDDVVRGVITVFRQEVRPFSDKQIALLQNFAAQAVIAMENARLITETREALEQQTATAEVLGVINSSPGDLTPVFETMLDKAMRLCEAAFGVLWTSDGDTFGAAALRGVPPDYIEFIASRRRKPTRDTALGELALGKDFVQIPDVASRPTSDEIVSRLVELGNVRTLLVVPLRKDGVLLGSIHVYRQEGRPFSDKQIALLQNFAAQAVIAMENARLITETREALQQQTATAEVLQVINSSPGDLAPVFDEMLEKATRLCEASHGILRTWDGERFHLAAVHGDARFKEWAQQRSPFVPEDAGGPLARLVKGEQVVPLTDALVEQAYRTSPGFREMVDASGLRSGIAVALRKDDALLGTLTVYRRELRPFSEKQIALLQNFAAQAVIAMENARLITETREALEQQTATAEVLGVINSSPGNLAPVFEAILEKAHTLCGAAFGSLFTYDGEFFHGAASHGLPEAIRPERRGSFRPGPNNPLWELARGAPLAHVADMREIASLSEPSEPGHLQLRAAIEQGGIRTMLMIPLRKDSALLGVISAFRQEVKPFTYKQIALLQNFAAQAVIAMENARLITETREALERQTATAEVLGVINSSPGDLTPVFDAILEKAHSLCGIAQGSLELYDGERFRAVAVRGLSDTFADMLRQGSPASDNPATRPLIEGERFSYIRDMAAADYSVERTAAETEGVRTLLCVPLRREGHLLGMIASARKEARPFLEKEIALLENFAAQAVIAMENVRLIGELRQRTEEVGELNRGLEARVAEQVDELGRVGRLKRFLAPQLAELIVSQGDEKILESHRREIVVVFCDLRGYTAFTETAEPEEVLEFLRQYHGALGPLVSQFEGTLDQFSGDGIMVFFNDPVPCPDPAERAVKMAVAMREAARELIAAWSRHGCELGFGVGIAQGFATLGQIGFSERSGYTAIGTVCNLAARLCAEAKDGQILISSRIAEAVEGVARLEDLGNLELKGLRRPVAAFSVVRSTSPAEARPNLTVVGKGPGA